MTEAAPGFVLDVYTKAMLWVGRLADPISFDGSAVALGRDSWHGVIGATDPMVDAVLAKGSRLTIRYRGVELSSGMIRTNSGSILPNGTVQFWVDGDGRIFDNTLAWVRPRGGIAPTTLAAGDPENWGQSWLPGGFSDAGPDGTTQGQTGYYLWPDGSAAAGGDLVASSESAIKYICRDNLVTRLGRPVTIAPDLLRGGDAFTAGILPDVRMVPLSEAIAPILAWSGLRVRARQKPIDLTVDNPSAYVGTITVDVYQPGTWSALLTPGSGIVTDGTWSLASPTSTRVISGGPGEGVNRAFAQAVDTALESAYGDVIEVFRDATGATLKWPTALSETLRIAKYFTLRAGLDVVAQAAFSDYLAAAGAAGLLDGQPTSGISATLSESETFYFGGVDGIQLSDTLSIYAAGQTFTEQLTEVEFSLNSKGLTVKPIIGKRADDTDRELADNIAKLAAAQRRLSASR